MIIFVIILCLFPLIVKAEDIHLSKDIQMVLAKIDTIPRNFQVEIIEENNTVGFVIKYPEAKEPTALNITFDLNAATIRQHYGLLRQGQEMGVNVELILPAKHFTHTFIYGDDPRIIFFNEDMVFIYKVIGSQLDELSVKEYIYVRRPNDARGTRFLWRYKPDRFGWPLTVEIDEKNKMGLYRNIPINGVTFADKSRRSHVISVVKQVMPKETYFPAHEKIADFSPIIYVDKEGIQRQADISITDEPRLLRSQSTIPSAPGKKIPDWSFLYSVEQNMLEVLLPAQKKQYPLFIE